MTRYRVIYPCGPGYWMSWADLLRHLRACMPAGHGYRVEDDRPC